MKNLLLVLFLLLSGVTFSQKYIKLVPEVLPNNAGCNGKVKSVIYGAATPYQTLLWYTNGQNIGFDLAQSNICENDLIEFALFDSDCGFIHSKINLNSDSLNQILLDTVLITMPSAPGMCDGQIQVFFNNLPSNYTIEFNSAIGLNNYSGPVDSTFTFTNLCEDTYQCTIKLNNIIQYVVGIDIFINPNTILPCELFDFDIVIDPLQTLTSCDGVATANPIFGPGGTYRYFFIENFVGSGSNIINPNELDNSLDSLCRGYYQIQIENDNSFLIKLYAVFIDTLGIIPASWNLPDSLLPNTDTILLNALNNCNLNYNAGIDTAYISAITGIGNGQYEFQITFIQDTNTIIINTYAIVDTSLNFFLDITTFCPDSSRSNSGYYSLRSMFYHGVKLQSTQSINENNLLSSFKIYPNPSEEIFQIDFESKESSLLNFEVTDITGKLIYSINYTSTIGKNNLNLELEKYSAGLYLLIIRNEHGLVDSKKLVKN